MCQDIVDRNTRGQGLWLVGEADGVRRRSFDLFNDPIWLAEPPGTSRSALYSSRVPFRFLLTSAALLATSMALPWYSSSETVALSPLSNWLNLGWGPGSRRWGFVILALALLVAIGAEIAVLAPRKALAGMLLIFEVLLLFATCLEVFAHPSIDPGPSLDADWGAALGFLAAIFAFLSGIYAMFVTQREPNS